MKSLWRNAWNTPDQHIIIRDLSPSDLQRGRFDIIPLAVRLIYNPTRRTHSNTIRPRVEGIMAKILREDV